MPCPATQALNARRLLGQPLDEPAWPAVNGHPPGVSAWIEDYNTRRRHSALGMMSPVDYEQALKAGQAA